MSQLSDYKKIKEFEKNGMPQLPAFGYEALAKSAEIHAKKAALHFFLDGASFANPVTWTYQQLLEKVNSAANLFNAYGLKQNETISYILPNLPATVVTFFGGEARGIINPINPMLENEHIAEIMKAAKSKMLVTLGPESDSELWQKIEKVVSMVPDLETVFTVSLDHYAGLPTEAPEFSSGKLKVLDLFKELKKQNKDKLDFKITASANSNASCFHTGGTTGSPKLAQRTHANELANAFSTNMALGLDAPKVFLCGLPWFHANATLATGMLPFYNGHTLVLATPLGYRDKEVIKNFWKIVDHFKVNLFSAVPTILKALLSVPVENSQINSLEFVICGAAPLSVQLYNDFQNATGIKILEGYGFTEGVCVNTINPARGERKIGSIGLPLAFHKMKTVVLDASDNYVRDAATDEIGVFAASGVNVFPGYKEEEDNKKAWILIDGEKWYNSGDIGRQDTDGYFWITGRKKELIIRAGHNIDPKSIEDPISRHPSVAAVAAVSRPDAHAGELPVAYVELKTGMSATVQELNEHASTAIHERAAIPKFIYIVDQLPLTAVGKIFKPELANRQVIEVYGEVAGAVKGVKDAVVEIRKDEVTGQIAVIKLSCDSLNTADVKLAVEAALGLYTIKYEIEF